MKKMTLVLLLLWSGVSFAQADIKAIDKYIEQARKDWNVPGMSVAIVKDGKVVLSKGYGTLEIGGKTAVNEHTQFAIASNTKAFVSAALSQLVQEGKLNWNDKVQQHLPYFALYDSYVSAETTVKDLLCHRVGLGTFSGDVIWYKSEKSAEEVVKRAKHVPQAYGFRDGYGYTNLMYIAAGEVIRSVTGQPWEQYVKEQFIAPLDMNRTVMSVSDLNDNAATPHKPTLNDGTIPIKWVNWDNMGAAGGIISSANDMAQWMLMHLNGGEWNGQKFFELDAQNYMWAPHNPFYLRESAKEYIPGRHLSGYGLGWNVMDYYGTLAVNHGGGYDGMYSRVMMIPDLKLGVVVLTNTMEGIATPLTYHIVNQYLKKDVRDWSKEFLERARASNGHKEAVDKRIAARVADTQPTKKPEEVAGTYHDPMYGNFTITVVDGQLRLAFQDAPLLSATLEHWHYDTYRIVWDEEHAWFDFGTVAIRLDNNQQVTGLEFDVPNYDIFFHELKPTKK